MQTYQRTSGPAEPGGADDRPGRAFETIAFLLLAFGVWPFVAIGVVGGFGLLVWIYQIFTGPPGPPGSIH